MTTFGQSLAALNSLSEAELKSLAKLKALELMNGFTFEYVRHVLKRDPKEDVICKENITIVRKIISQKEGGFFGYKINVKGESLELLIDYMAKEFRQGKSDEFYTLERKICVLCYKEILQEIAVIWEKANSRFAPYANSLAIRHMQQQLNTVAIEAFFRNSDLIVIRL